MKRILLYGLLCLLLLYVAAQNPVQQFWLLNNSYCKDFTVAAGETYSNNLPTFTVKNLMGTGTYNILSGKLLQLGCGNSTGTTSAILEGTGALEKIGTGTITLLNDNTYTGNTTITAGTLQVGDCLTGSLGAGFYGGNIVNNGNLIISTPQDQTLSGIISGTGNFTQSCGFTTFLSGANTFTGSTTLLNGVISLAHANALANTSKINFNGGSLQYSTDNNKDYSAKINNAGNQNIIIDNNGQNITYATAIAGANTSFTLNNSNVSTSTEIDTEYLLAAGGGAGGRGGSYKAGGGGGAGEVRIGNLTLNADTPINISVGAGGVGTNADAYGTNGGNTILDNVTVVGGGAGGVSNSSNSNINGKDGGSGGGTSGKDGGTLTAAASLATAPGMGNAGGKTIGNNMRNGAGGGGAVEAGGNADISISNTPGKGGMGYTSTITGISNVYGSGGNGGSRDNATQPTPSTNGGIGGLTAGKAGGNGTANTGSGGGGGGSSTSGTFAKGGNGGSGVVIIAYPNTYPNLSVSAGLSYTLNTTSRAGYKVYKFTGGSGTIMFPSGGGGVILSGNNTYTGSTTINAGVLQVGNGTNGSLGNGNYAGNIFNGSSLIFNTNVNQTLSGIMSGTGLLSQTGTNNIILNGTNTFNGYISITNGTLQIGDATNGVLGNGNFSGSILNNSNLIFNTPTDQILSGAITGGGALTQSGTNVLALAEDNSFNGTVTINSGTLQLGNGGTTGSLYGGNYTGINIVNNSNFSFKKSNTVIFDGNISGTGSFTQAGSGTTIFTNNNTYTGLTNITDGTLQLGNSQSTPSLSNGDIINNSILSIKSASGFTLSNNISGSGQVVVDRSDNNSIPNAEYLLVAGGGGGGSGCCYIPGGGGGAGEVNVGTLTFSSGNSLTVTVGAGGDGSISGSNRGANGNNTILGGITVAGGGGGATVNSNVAGNGGSGGGGVDGGTAGSSVTLSTGGMGNNGGSTATGLRGGAGGGGATSVGSNGVSQNGADGGAGYTSSITGISDVYGSGGGGGSRTGFTPGNGGVNAGNGGNGVGAKGEDAVANFGGGGGGAGSDTGGTTANGGAGGSGVVIVAYPDTYPNLSISSGLSYTLDTNSRVGYKVYKFTAGTGTISFVSGITFSGNNTYTGGTIVDNGIITAGSSNAFGTGAITLATGTVLNKNGFTLPNTIINNGGTVNP